MTSGEAEARSTEVVHEPIPPKGLNLNFPLSDAMQALQGAQRQGLRVTARGGNGENLSRGGTLLPSRRSPSPVPACRRPAAPTSRQRQPLPNPPKAAARAVPSPAADVHATRQHRTGRWNWGLSILHPRRLRRQHLPGLDALRPAGDRRPVPVGLGRRPRPRQPDGRAAHRAQPRLSGLAATYVEVFRNIPCWCSSSSGTSCSPELLPFGLGDAFKQDLDPLTQQFLSAMLCLAFFTSARVCEQVAPASTPCPAARRTPGWPWASPAPDLPPRAPADGLPPGGAAAHLRVPQHLQELRRVLDHRPAGARRPGAASSSVDYTAQPYESFIAVTVLYLLINVVVMTLMRVVENKTRVPGYLGEVRCMNSIGRPSPGAALPVGGHEGVAGDHAHRGGLRHRGGTALAMMRLSAVKPLAFLCRQLREPVPGDSAGDGAAVVLPDRAPVAEGLRQPGPEHRRAPRLGDGGLRAVRVGVLLRDHPRRHPERPQGPGGGRLGAGHDLRPGDAPGGAAAGLPQHGPLLLTQAIVLFQDTSLVYVSALADFFGAATRWATAMGGSSSCCSLPVPSISPSALRPPSWCAATRKLNAHVAH